MFKSIINKIKWSNHGFFVTSNITLFLNGFEDEIQQRDEDAYFGIPSSSIAYCSFNYLILAFLIYSTSDLSTY